MSDILSEAAVAVDERQGRYGTPADNGERIAALWTAYLEGRGLLDLERTDGITATDYFLMQALVKIARLEHGYHHDSVVDLAGYAACAAQINEPEPLPKYVWVDGDTHMHLRSEVGNETPSGLETSRLYGACGNAHVDGNGFYRYCVDTSGHSRLEHRDAKGAAW